jgi:hypothetical protein
MKKYTASLAATSPAITTSTTIISLARYSGGVVINGQNVALTGWISDRDLSKFNYGGILYNKTRQISMIPESASDGSNTVITRDGLVAVIYQVSSVNYVSVVDLFDTGLTDYDTIQPEDYSALLSYLTSTNPENKSVFVAYKAGSGDNFETKNILVYKAGGFSYFASDMDTGLPTDDYGYHEIADASFEAETDTFTFLKKQFIVVEGPSVTASTDGFATTLTPLLTDGNRKVYWFKDTGITGEDDLIELNFRSSSSNYATIKVY